MVQQPQYDRSGPKLSWVLGGTATLTLLFGVLSYKRYAESERWVAQGIAQMQSQGQSLDAEGCIDAAVTWHDACEDEGANAAVCLQGVKLVLFHCLAAKPRVEACEPYMVPQLDPRGKVDPGDWVYMRCIDRGMTCKQRRECACAETYRTLESFCRHDGKGVVL